MALPTRRSAGSRWGRFRGPGHQEPRQPNLVAGFTGSPDPQQPGQPSPISDAANGLPTDAVWQAERMVISSSLGCNPAGGIVETRACVRVTELDTGPALPTRTIDFLIAEAGMDLYMGGAALALNGDLHVVWTRSSGIPGQYPSSQTAAQLAHTDSRNTIGVRSTIAAGTGTYPGSQWGDYAGIAFDRKSRTPSGRRISTPPARITGRLRPQLRATGSSYTPITPRRVLDTRPASPSACPAASRPMSCEAGRSPASARSGRRDRRRRQRDGRELDGGRLRVGHADCGH